MIHTELIQFFEWYFGKKKCVYKLSEMSNLASRPDGGKQKWHKDYLDGEKSYIVFLAISDNFKLDVFSKYFV